MRLVPFLLWKSSDLPAGSETPVLINPESVASVRPSGLKNASMIVMRDGYEYFVYVDTIEEVARMLTGDAVR